MKLHNLAKNDERSSEIYKKFKYLYFEQSLTDGDSLKKNAEEILNFSNDIINIIIIRFHKETGYNS